MEKFKNYPKWLQELLVKTEKILKERGLNTGEIKKLIEEAAQKHDVSIHTVQSKFLYARQAEFNEDDFTWEWQEEAERIVKDRLKKGVWNDVKLHPFWDQLSKKFGVNSGRFTNHYYSNIDKWSKEVGIPVSRTNRKKSRVKELGLDKKVDKVVKKWFKNGGFRYGDRKEIFREMAKKHDIRVNSFYYYYNKHKERLLEEASEEAGFEVSETKKGELNMFEAAAEEARNVEPMKLEVGDIVEVTIFEIREYGAIGMVEEYDMKGMIHISEIKDDYISDINNYFHVGQVVNAKVIKINDDDTLRLSTKGLEVDELSANIIVINREVESAEKFVRDITGKPLTPAAQEKLFELVEEHGSFTFGMACKKIEDNYEFDPGLAFLHATEEAINCDLYVVTNHAKERFEELTGRKVNKKK